MGQVGAQAGGAGSQDSGVVEAGVVHGLLRGVLDLVVALLAGGCEGVGVAGHLDPRQLAVLREEHVPGQGEVRLVESGGGEVETAGLGCVCTLVDVLEVVAGVVEPVSELLGLGQELLDAWRDAGGTGREPVGAPF